LTRAIVALASQYGRYGYRRITSLLVQAGWQVGCDRVQRIWRREGLKVPRKHKPRGRLWLNDGSCIRLRPTHRNHVWSYDFVEAQTHDGRRIRLMTLIDEYTRECLAIRVARRINSLGVIETMADVMLTRGVPEHIRSDNGAEMTAKVVRNWLDKLGTAPLYIEPGSPWENGYCESFNGKLRDECLNQEILLQLEGSAGRHRAMAQSIQHDPTALIARIGPATCRVQRALSGSVRRSRSKGALNATYVNQFVRATVFIGLSLGRRARSSNCSPRVASRSYSLAISSSCARRSGIV
jgi:transposase InsO family protein